MLASYHGHLPLTRLLLQHSADPNRLNDRQQSPLSGAIFKGEDAIVEALLDGGADPRVGNPSAIDAVNIFGQQEKWGRRLEEKVKQIGEQEGAAGNVIGHGNHHAGEDLRGEDGEEIYEEAKVPGE